MIHVSYVSYGVARRRFVEVVGSVTRAHGEGPALGRPYARLIRSVTEMNRGKTNVEKRRTLGLRQIELGRVRFVADLFHDCIYNRIEISQTALQQFL